MYKIINMNKEVPHHVGVLHADGRRDTIMVMGPKRPVFLRVGMKPDESAYLNTDLNITEVQIEQQASSSEQLVDGDGSEQPAGNSNPTSTKKVK